jgi:hypothetical protein
MRSLPLFLRVLHWVIIVNAALNICYAAYQVFVVLAPEGKVGPLSGNAADIPHELLVARRLYAIEAWITLGALVIYLALTEYLPRLLQAARASE